MRVKLNGPAGTYTTQFGDEVKQPPLELEFGGRRYTYNGFQDSQAFYKEDGKAQPYQQLDERFTVL